MNCGAATAGGAGSARFRVGSGYLRGDALADFVSLGFDDHVKFILAEAQRRQVRRDYTPRVSTASVAS